MSVVVWTIVGIIVVLIIGFILSGIKVVPQTHVRVIERFGSFHKILKNGINWIFPLVDRTVVSESLKEKVIDFPSQDVITRDNVTMKIDTDVYMQITDPKLFAYGVDKPMSAVENMTATTLRNLIGDLELDQTLTSRDTINERLRDILDGASDAWGIKIIRVELKNILPPKDIIRAMEKQMRAEREKREQILVAEGRKKAAILNAEGLKESTILTAQATRQKSILEAEGKKKSIQLINESNPTRASLIIKSFEAIAEAANKESTTILMPTNLTEISSLAATFKAVTRTSGGTSSAPAAKTQSLKDIINEVESKHSTDK